MNLLTSKGSDRAIFLFSFNCELDKLRASLTKSSTYKSSPLAQEMLEVGKGIHTNRVGNMPRALSQALHSGQCFHV